MLPGLDGDRHTMLVRTADEEHVFPSHPQISDIYVRRHVNTGKMTYVHRSVGIRKRTSHQCSLVILFHIVFFLSFLFPACGNGFPPAAMMPPHRTMSAASMPGQMPKPFPAFCLSPCEPCSMRSFSPVYGSVRQALQLRQDCLTTPSTSCPDVCSDMPAGISAQR